MRNLFLYLTVGCLMASNLFQAFLLKDLRERADRGDIVEACRSRACRHSEHVGDCVDECSSFLLGGRP